MGLFSGGNSSSNTSAPNTGSQSQVGDPLAINISAGDDQNATLNVQRNLTLEQTDFGAVESAFGLGESALVLADEFDKRRSKDLGESLSFSRTALVESTRAIDLSNRRAFDSIDDTVGRSLQLAGQSSRDVIDFAADTQGLFTRLTDSVISTVERSQQASEGLASDVLTFVQKDREPLVEGVVTIVKQVAIAVAVAFVASKLIGSK